MKKKLHSQDAINTIRKTLTREQYENFRNESPIQRYTRLLEGEQDTELITHYTDMLELAREFEAAEVKKNAELISRGKHLKDTALAQGPLFAQRISYKLGDIFSFVQNILSILYGKMVFVFPIVWVLAVIFALAFNLHFSLKANGVLNTLALLVSAVAAIWGGLAILDKSASAEQASARVRLLLASLLFGLLAVVVPTCSWKSFKNNDYMGIVLRKGQVVNVMELEDNFVASPSLLHGDHVMWYRAGGFEAWDRALPFLDNGTKLLVRSRVSLHSNTEELKRLALDGQSLDGYVEEMHSKVDEEIYYAIKADPRGLPDADKLKATIDKISKGPYSFINTSVVFEKR